MRNLRNKSIANYALLISAILIIASLNSSCKKDAVVNPDYVGTWASTQAILDSIGIVQIKDVITMTKDKFTDVGQFFDESSNKFIDYIKLVGSLTVAETIMNVHVTEIGISTFDGITGMPTGTIIMYKEGSAQYESLFSQTGQSKTFGFEYSVSGNSLTIYTDLNGDGDYADANETVVYTKQ